MTTTGRTPTSNIEAMITGYEELEEEEDEVRARDAYTERNQEEKTETV
jgi:hypothetical protein